MQSYIPNRHNRKLFLSLALLIPLLLFAAFWGMVITTWADGSPTAPYTLDTGYLDFSYGSTVKDSPSGEKPESKLWWNDGLWWAVLWNDTTKAYEIYWLDWGDQVWRSTGVIVDTRADAKVDTMWDESAGKLYVTSHIYTERGARVNTPDNWGRLYRFSYDASTRTYTLDSGFPVTVNENKTETLVLAKDSKGRLWVTYVSRPKGVTDTYYVYVNATTSPNDDTSWGTPFIVPGPITDTTVYKDDISSVVAFRDSDGKYKIGVMWSNQLTGKVYFAVHDDNQPPGSGWTLEEPPLPANVGADDHINLKSLGVSGSSQVFAVVKTKAVTSTDPLIGVIARDTDGSYSFITYSTKADNDTRPILLVDDDADKVYVFVTGKPGGSKICYKVANITSPLSNMSFAPGNCGTDFIADNTYNDIDNATSTKQNVNATTGLVVLATDDGPKVYVHNVMGDPPPVITLRSPDFNATDVPLNFVVQATFSKEMKSSTITTSNFTLQDDSGPVAGTLTYDNSTRTATFTPTATIKASTRYTVTVTRNVKDTGGQRLYREESWSFTTVSPTVQLSAASYSVNENDGTVTITATLNAPSGQTVTVDYATSDGTATAGSEYTDTSGTLTFNPGETEKTFTVPIIDDNIAEPSKTFNVALSNPTNAALGAVNSAPVVISDDEGDPTVQFDPTTYSVSEGGGTVTATVRLSHPSAFTVTVDYMSADGTAVAGSDYTSTSGTLKFNPGETSKMITVPIVDNTLDESDETFTIKLQNPVSATLGTPNDVATVTIADDDPAPTVQFQASSYSVSESGGSAAVVVTLSTQSALTVTVDYATQDLSAKAGLDYTAMSGTLEFAPGTTSQTVNIPIQSDALDEIDETFNVLLSNPNNATLGSTATTSVQIVDNDDPPTVQFSAASYSANEGAGTATVTVTLSAPSGRLVSVDVKSSDGTAKAGSDYTAVDETVTFSPGQTAVTLTVNLTDDALDEDDETLTLTLSNADDAVLSAPTTAQLTVVDDDPVPTVQFSAASYVADEGTGSATITVTLSAPSGRLVSVDVSTSDGTAKAGSDYTAFLQSVTFAPGETSKTVSVAIPDTTTYEGDRTFTVALSSPTNAVLGTVDTSTVTIMEDEYGIFLPVVFK